MTGTYSSGELAELAHSLFRPTALVEVGIVVLCLLLAGLLLRLARGQVGNPKSVWFGRRIVDGVLFPLLALLFALIARWMLHGQIEIAVFKIVIPTLVSLAVIRLLGRVLRRAFPDSDLMRAFERSLSWFAWIGVALWISGVLPQLMDELGDIRWKVGAAEVSVRNIIEGTFTAVVVLVLALWASSELESRLLAGASGNLGIRKMAANTIRALLLFVGLLFALEAAGIDLTALGVIGGALGVGIGFGLQKLAANYVSGFVILAENAMRIGDTVKVDGFEGRIADITTRYTVIRSLGGRESIVPNEMMITQRVENSTLADPKVLLSTVVQVAYGTDLDALFPKIVEAIAPLDRVLVDQRPAVQLSNFAADGLELTIYFWIADPQNGSGNVRSAVNLAILRLLNAEGIEIPYPQRVLRRAGPSAPSPG
ncbi:MAG: mechanosensitive ion channel [Burkholderiales bacterium]|nr:mechanosensitive ion channel [Burkholderiales bacterium]